MKFKVGDKVFYKPSDRKGEVLGYYGACYGYLVGFKDFDGHNGLYDVISKGMKLEIERKGYKDQCWWCSENSLELVKESKEMPKFNHENKDIIKITEDNDNQFEIKTGGFNDEISMKELEQNIQKAFQEDEKPEMVNSPLHYNSCGEYETIKKMELLFGKEAVLTWARLTAFKYRDRLEFKENKEQDTAKMDWYLRYIEENE